MALLFGVLKIPRRQLTRFVVETWLSQNFLRKRFEYASNRAHTEL